MVFSLRKQQPTGQTTVEAARSLKNPKIRVMTTLLRT
jgi:hypothetical protein